jgi:hypothetical protein
LEDYRDLNTRNQKSGSTPGFSRLPSSSGLFLDQQKLSVEALEFSSSYFDFYNLLIVVGKRRFRRPFEECSRCNKKWRDRRIEEDMSEERYFN